MKGGAPTVRRIGRPPPPRPKCRRIRPHAGAANRCQQAPDAVTPVGVYRPLQSLRASFGARGGPPPLNRHRHTLRCLAQRRVSRWR